VPYPAPTAPVEDRFESPSSAKPRRPLDPYAPSRPNELMVAHWNAEKLMEPNIPRAELLLPSSYCIEDLWRHAENLGLEIRRLNGGIGPEILALTEVGSRRALDALAETPALRELGYDTRVVLETSDQYGMHPALLSRYPLWEPPRLLNLDLPGSKEKARESLEVTLDVDGIPVTTEIVHAMWRGGGNEHVAERIHGGSVLRERVQELLRQDPQRAVVIVGDFNDDMEDPSISSKEGLHAAPTPEESTDQRVYNTTESVKAMKLADGELAPNRGIQVASSYWEQRNAWNSFDQLLISRPLVDGSSRLSWIPGSTVVVADPALRRQTADQDPHPFFIAGDGVGLVVNDDGISDHFPIIARLRKSAPTTERPE
jgi:endonuclease/exonuclease/phosphatase family metal-dependent hydrolase